MQNAKLLDCTLRDGAYIIDKKFGDTTIKGIIAGLIKANLDLIEIGFLQDEGFGEGKTVYKNAYEAEKFIPKDKGDTLFTVLADYSRYSVKNLDNYTGRSFDAVRACFFKNERYDAIDFFKAVKEKGYKLFIQPVDVLGYSDTEIIELINIINKIEPYCFSIVDTFGSMYEEDLQRVYYLIDHNLISGCRIGFHSHNNLQMSNALTQLFLKMSYGKRNVVVDATVAGMGRGAGNTPTELIAQYMVNKLGYNYEIDSLLDVIDNYIKDIRAKATWGYDTNMFLAGTFSAHVNNIAYLKNKNSIKSKDIRYILNKIGRENRKRYHYDLLEKTYYEYMKSNINDSETILKLKNVFANKTVVLLAPGHSAIIEQKKIKEYINANKALVVSINFLHKEIKSDYLYMSNLKRYNDFSNTNYNQKHKIYKKIITSNIKTVSNDNNENIISISRLLKCGWENMDNSAILLLRLLNILEVKKIGIAGLDGYEYTATNNNYINDEMEVYFSNESAILVNQEIADMLKDFSINKNKNLQLEFITSSRFKNYIK